MPCKKTMRTKLRTIALGLASALGSTACYDGALTNSSTAGENVSPPKRDKVKVVPLEELAQIKTFALDGALLVTSTPWWGDVYVDDILVMEVSELTPEGSLRRVTSVQPSADGIALETTQSVLTEVFEDGQLSLQVPLSASPIQEVIFAEEGVAVVPSNPVVPLRLPPGFRAEDSDEGLSVSFKNVVLYDRDNQKATTGDRIVLDGTLSADLDMDISVEIGLAKIKRFSTGITVTGKSELEVKASPLIEVNEEKSILKAKLQPIVINVFVPIVIVPTVELVAKFKATVDAFAISAKRSDSVTYSASLVRENKQWTPGFERTVKHTPFTPAIGGVGATEITVWVGPRITTKVYALAGPSLDYMGSLRLVIEKSLWKLFAGLSASIGIEFGIGDWDFTKLTFAYTFIDEEGEIAHGSVLPGVCGDGKVNGAESCDGSALGGHTCESQGVGSGNLACTAGCTFDISGCAGMSCGDDTLDDGEVCDGNFIAETCEGLGHDGGVLSCTPSCALDESGCCDNTCVPAESECMNAAMRHCLPLADGCYAWDKWIPCADGCDGALCYNAMCGNDIVDGADGEQCDGANLNGQACTTVGFDGGKLACSGCLFDASNCCDDGFTFFNAEYPSTTISANGCALDAGVTLKLSAQDNGSSLRFRVTKSDGSNWGTPAVLHLYVGTGPTCGTPMNESKVDVNVVVGEATQIIDLNVDPYVGGWGEGTTKEFWVGKSENGSPAGRASGTISIERDVCP